MGLELYLSSEILQVLAGPLLPVAGSPVPSMVCEHGEEGTLYSSEVNAGAAFMEADNKDAELVA